MKDNKVKLRTEGQGAQVCKRLTGMWFCMTETQKRVWITNLDLFLAQKREISLQGTWKRR